MNNATTLPTGRKYCIACATVLDMRAELCPSCGVRQPSARALTIGPRNRLLAAILAFFLGGFGAHKFYVGQYVLGVVYLVFFWTLLPFLISIVEGVLYLAQTDEAFERKYGAAA